MAKINIHLALTATRKLLVVAATVVILFASVESSTTSKRDLQTRPKRSFRWLPFFGNGEANTEADGAVKDDTETDDTTINDVEAPTFPSQYISSALPQPIAPQFVVPSNTRFGEDASAAGGQVPDINAILSRGQVINNQVHYPIWSVHKYNGIHFQPLPVSAVQSNERFQNYGLPQQTIQKQYQQLQSPPRTSVFQIPQSYQQFSNAQFQQNTAPDTTLTQSTSDTSNIFDNTQAEPSRTPSDMQLELLELAKELGITDFSNLPDLGEIMNLLGTTTQEETIQAIRDLAATEDGRQLIRQFIENDDDQAAASEISEDTVQSDGTDIIRQYLLPGSENSALGLLPQGFPLNLTGVLTPAADETGDEQATNPNLFQRIVNFLNPLANREEIPIPPNEVVSDYISGDEPTDVNVNTDQAVVSQDTVPVPQLPELPPLPDIPGIEVPALPQVHIPRRLFIPTATNRQYSSVPSNSRYIRIKTPTSGFSHTPRIPIDPKYIYHYQNPLWRQQQQQQKVQGFHVGQIVKTQNIPSSQAQIQTETHELPTITSKNTFSSDGIKSTESQINDNNVITNVGQLPLIRDTNYEVFKNAPRITTSYGTPALPYTYQLDSSVNSFVPSSAPTSFIHQEYELRSAASEEKAQHQTKDDDNTKSVAQTPAQHEFVEDDESAIVSNHNYDTTSPEVQSKKAEPIELIEEEATTTATELPKFNNRRKTNAITVKEKNKRLAVRGPERMTSYDAVATEKEHKDDAKAKELLPLTVRHMLESEGVHET